VEYRQYRKSTENFRCERIDTPTRRILPQNEKKSRNLAANELANTSAKRCADSTLRALVGHRAVGSAHARGVVPFSRAYTLSPQAVVGVVYGDGKSATPPFRVIIALASGDCAVALALAREKWARARRTAR
jgi:hypothetical protein